MTIVSSGQQTQILPCAHCDTSITSDNDSKEHIIPNAIGGRRKIGGFICRSCNSRTGDTWDKELAEQLNPLGLLLRISRQEGDLPSQTFETIGGQRIRLKADGRMELPNPVFRKTQQGESVEVQIQARSIEEAKGMLQGLKRKHPNLDVEQALKKMNDQAVPLEDPLKMSFQFGGNHAGRAVVKSALAMAYSSGVRAQDCETALKYLKDTAAPACFGFYYEKDLILNRAENAVFHCIGVSGSKNTGLLLAYVEYYGAQRIIVCLSNDYAGPDVHSIYTIEPITGKELELQFAIPLNSEDLNAIYNYEKIPPGAMEAAFRAPLSTAIGRDFEVEKNRAIAEAVDYGFKNCGAAEGDYLTPEHLQKLTGLMIEKLQPFLIRHIKKDN
jgi:hypothetical protein